MEPRERVEAALLGRSHDFVPFALSADVTPRSDWERALRNDGLCLVDGTRVHEVVYREVTIERTHFTGADGCGRIRTTVHTPAGILTALDQPGGFTAWQPGGFTTWHEERLFKSAADYEPLEAFIQDRQYLPTYEAFEARQRMLGGDSFPWVSMHYSPLMEILYDLMGLEQFSLQWAENRDRLMHLYNVLLEDKRKLYPLAAASPAPLVQYCGNVAAEVVGRERFERYVLPAYEEAAEVLHAHGKLLAVHLDANTKLLADAVARSSIDVICAFTPAPSCDMTVAEARAAWPDKALWINYPSSVHLASVETVEAVARQILREAAPGERVVMGITETVPEERWAQNYAAILRACREAGRLPIRA